MIHPDRPKATGRTAVSVEYFFLFLTVDNNLRMFFILFILFLHGKSNYTDFRKEKELTIPTKSRMLLHDLFFS
jgi:hypothetical protein